jgi:hypothetical protein
MCIYPDVLASGPALALQAFTALSIAASIAFWAWAYRKQGVGLGGYAVPIILWVVFGTLDILITARGTFLNPTREGNPLARFIFVESGYAGPMIASVLWIALWSSVVLLANKKAGPRLAPFISLAVFYSLATGHLFGFSSWFVPLCPIARALPPLALRLPLIIAIGCALAAVHLALQRKRIL